MRLFLRELFVAVAFVFCLVAFGLGAVLVYDEIKQRELESQIEEVVSWLGKR